MLNGLGLGTKHMVKVYVAGLYLPQKSSDAVAIFNAHAPERIVMHFLHGASKKQMSDAFDESFSDNMPMGRRRYRPISNACSAQLEPVKQGDPMVFTYVPGTGTTLAINGNDKMTIAGPAECSSPCGWGLSHPMRV